MLQANLTAKSFYVYNAEQSNFVSNFLQGVSTDINSCDPTGCTYYGCSGSVCQTPVNICDCAGTIRSGTPPNLGPPAHVTDVNGQCCLPSAIDCAGVCNGGAFYESTCGVCVPAGTTALPAGCIADCTGTYYLSTAPTNGAAFLPLPNLPSPAGYLIAQGNSDLVTAAVNAGGWNAAAVQGQYQTAGRFQGRYNCTFDYAYYISQSGSSCGSQSACETEFLNYNPEAIFQGAASNARCLAGSLTKIAPQITNNCGACVANAANPPNCAQGCASGCGPTSQGYPACTTVWSATPLSLDSCGVCNGNNAAQDSCGVCFGNNAEKDPCGNCPSSPNYKLGKDKCNNNLCANLNCSTMCNNETFSGSGLPSMGLDKCGNCVALVGNTYPNNASCVLQCDQTYYDPNGPAPQPVQVALDNCNQCYVVGNDTYTCVQDCAGTWNGVAYYDQCGQCVGGASTHDTPCIQDCDATYYLTTVAPPHTKDICGNCVLQANVDQHTIVCGACVVNTTAAINAQYDNCGNCVNQANYNSSWCLVDCNGAYYNASTGPVSFDDFCGVCITPQTKNLTNYDMDSCGVCWPGGPSNPMFNHNVTIDPMTGSACGCNTPLVPCPFYGNNLTCLDCPPYCPAPLEEDRCNRCSNTPLYNVYDACNACCYTNETCTAPPPERDLCGTCLGPISTSQALAAQTCGMCPPSTPDYVPYFIDCAGVCFGNHTYDCRGVCGINGTSTFCNVCTNSSTCAQICGNGIKEGTEQCDDGANNGPNSSCSTSCTINSQNQTGAIVGGVVGGLAALLALIALAAFLVHYAKKNGLLGFGNKQVDMNAANMNSLYKPQTIIATNPLYNDLGIASGTSSPVAV